MNKKRVSILVVSVLLIGTMLFAAGAQETTKPSVKMSDEFNWEQFSGSTVVFNYPNHVHYNAMVESGVLDEFTAKTGIKVESDRMQYMNMHDAQILQMSKSKGDYDLITMVVMWKSEYAMSNLIRPLQPYFDTPRLAAPDYNFDDLVPAYVEVTGIAGGKNIYKDGPGAQLFGLPFGAETSFLVYRKDLFDKYNVKVPTTYAEIETAAKFFAENVPGVYGLTMRAGSGHHATHGWLLHASPFGATVFDENWEPAFTSKEAIETIEFMKTMIKYGPPGMEGFTQDEEFAAFLQGDAAMYLDASVFAGPVKDPTKSRVYDKIAFAPHPKAKTSLSETGGFGLGIPTNAHNPEAAFLLMQYLTLPEVERKIVMAGGAPFRMSTVKDASLYEKYPEFAVLAEQLEYANADWRPIIPEWGEINNLLGIAINQGLTGVKTPKEAMQDVVEPIRKIMIRSGYIK